MVRIEIILTEEQAAKLRRLATRRSVTQEALVREALERLTHEETARRRVKRARQSMGAFESGYDDTSAHHDAVLDEVYSG